MSPLRFYYTKLSQASVLLPIIAGLRYYKRLNPAFRIFLYFFFIGIGTEWAMTNSLKLYHNENNMPIGHFFVLVEFLVFSLMYYLHYREQRVGRLLIGINTLVGVGMVLVGVWKTSIWGYPTLGRCYSAASITIYTLIYFFFLFKDIKQDGRGEPMFWLSVGALAYFGSNLTYFTYSAYLLEKPGFIDGEYVEGLGWYTHDALNIIAHCLYAQAFRCFRNSKTIL